MSKSAPPSHLRPVSLPAFYFGVCYYPEHWDAETRREDASRMQAAGIKVIRMAEFAAEFLEPVPGNFQFDLFDETIEMMGRHGIQTILGTPTAAPPRWLSMAHPEALAVDEHGVPQQHGSRQHMSLSHPAMKDYSRRVTRAMAEHYASHPQVIGWQTDNEFHCHFSADHSPAAQEEFRVFLRQRYQDRIDDLNEAWGTRFWAQTYSSFAQIEAPRQAAPCFPNPGQKLDYARFLSWRATSFQKEQIEILRAAQPEWFVFHNGCFAHIDYRGPFTRDLDCLGYDSYPGFSFDVTTRASDHAYNLDRVRAWSGNFLIPEHQSGPGGQASYFHDQPEPGEMRKMTYTSIAHGADGLLYFRWRTCRYGAEMYWCGILDHDNIPRRRYEELTQIGQEIAQLGSLLMGSSVRVEVGIASADFDALEARATLPFGLPSLANHAETIHRWFYERHYAVGCVHPADVLDGLRILVIPHWEVMDPSWLPALTTFVEKGGTLILGARCGTRDGRNQVIPTTAPGFLRPLAGVSVEEGSRKNRADQRPWLLQWGDATLAAEDWVEILQPETGTEVLAHWTSRYAAGRAAITRRPLGEGQVIYIGTILTASLMATFGPQLVQLSGLQPILPGLPEEVECTVRTRGKESLWFLINHADEPRSLVPPPGTTPIIGEKPSPDKLHLPAYGVSVLQRCH